MIPRTLIRYFNTTSKSIVHFPRRLVENQYKVRPPPIVPDHIIKPQYAISKNPQFAEYEGKPHILTK